MEKYRIVSEQITDFMRQLKSEERSQGTIDKYMRDIHAFAAWLGGELVTQERAADWKEHLLAAHYAPRTVNSMLAALNRFFAFLGWYDCRTRSLKIQRQVFRDTGRDLTREEYLCLVAEAQQTNQLRLALVMETIGAVGIRVSELKYITVEAAKAGKAVVCLKGKVRTILLPNALCRKLLRYAQKQKTTSGEIFLTRNGTPLSRKQIWREMKKLCDAVKIAPSKVFPHNLRHMFAQVFYNATHDIAKLADVLGHANIETTRTYLISTGIEHRNLLESLRLLC